MSLIVRPLRADELRTYLEIVSQAIRGLAAASYAREAIESWAPTVTDDSLRELERNEEGEIRLMAELHGARAGIGALVPARSELRACYVLPEAARRGCGSAIVRELERLAKARGLTRLHLTASLNAEAFYASLGYRARDRGAVVLPNGHRLACVWMERDL